MFLRKPSSSTVTSISTSSSSLSTKTTTNGLTQSPSSTSVTTPTTPANPTTPGSGENGFHFTRAELKTPPPSDTYHHSQALDDLPFIRNILHMFLAGRMLEAEEQCNKSDPKAERLYTSSGWGIIQALKGLMSFEEADIAHALEAVRRAALVAGQHRKPATSLTARLAGLVVGNSHTSGVGFIKSMTPVERHAELVYSECLLEKAILGIVSSGDWLTFIREFINIRSATNVYRTLAEFIRAADAEAVARGEGPEDKSIDPDFRSGVALGIGINSLCLTLLPDNVSSIVALFGYKGDRTEALSILSRPGGWVENSEEPTIGPDTEGLRRPCTDLTLLIFHLFISSFTYNGVNIPQARKIVEYNLRLFPEGVFFLFLKGMFPIAAECWRLHVIESRPDLAIELYEKGMTLTEYKSLKGVAHWEVGLCRLTLCDFAGAVTNWRAQESDANWSKAVYCYGLACCLYEAGGEKNQKEAAQYFAKISTVLRRIAGKSIPAEKFAARKARKYASQGQRLLLPGLELAYILGAIQHTPRKVFLNKTILMIEAALKTLSESSSDPSSYFNGHGYWDDLSLAHLLHGVCLRYVAFPDPEAVESEEEAKEVMLKMGMGVEEMTDKAFEQLKWVVENGPKIELDHQYVYCAHLELGKLYACTGDKAEARRQLEMVLSGKPLEVNPAGRKAGKYSMQNAIHVKAHSALDALESGRL
ncbi:hypothetical protein FRB99_000127 [Tulasnella sp. 403]|nr:hypothetical protein FRB99_000127 [Tulasnella sp. 403]